MKIRGAFHRTGHHWQFVIHRLLPWQQCFIANQNQECHFTCQWMTNCQWWQVLWNAPRVLGLIQSYITFSTCMGAWTLLIFLLYVQSYGKCPIEKILWKNSMDSYEKNPIWNKSYEKTRLIRLRAVDGYASDITRYSIDLSYNPHSYSPLVLQPTFDLWPWADLAQNLISSSTPGGAPLYQVWWKSTQGFLGFCVNEVKIAYLDQVHWPLTFGESRPKSNQFIYSWWCIHVPSLMKIHQGVLEISR